MGQQKSKLQKLKQKAEQCQSKKSLCELVSSENVDVNGYINTADFERVTPLWFAAKHNDVALAKQLIAVGADVNLSSGNLDMAPLHIAAYMLDEEMVSLLLDNGANCDILDNWNYSPLMYVAINFEPLPVHRLFTMLIKAECDVNFGAVLDSNGEQQNCKVSDMLKLNHYEESAYVTYVKEPLGAISGSALHFATQNPHLPNECLEILLEAGANVNIRNLHGQVPLMSAFMDTYYDYHSNVQAHAELLITLGSDLNIRDNSGWACFHYAAQRGSVQCMELLLRHNADCNALSADSVSPLWLLLVHGWREATRYLLLSGCNLDIPIPSSTIIHINQNVNVCRYGNILPLEFALCNKYYSLAKLMLRSGCALDESMFVGDVQDPQQADFMCFINSVKESARRALGLKEMCRCVIRRTLQQGILLKVTSLGLPNVMCDYITLTDQ